MTVSIVRQRRRTTSTCPLKKQYYCAVVVRQVGYKPRFIGFCHLGNSSIWLDAGYRKLCDVLKSRYKRTDLAPYGEVISLHDGTKAGDKD